MATTIVQRLNQDTSAQRAMGLGLSGQVKCLPVTVELAASASGTTVDFGFIPSTARVLGISKVYNDDLATSGSPTLDIGLKAGAGNYTSVTADPDAIGNGFALSSASTGTKALSEIANVGLPAWDLVNGLTADCGGTLTVYGSVVDAATTASGTVSIELYYTVD